MFLTLKLLRRFGYRRIGVCSQRHSERRSNHNYLAALQYFQPNIPREERVPALVFQNGATLAGNGFIKPTSGAGVIVNGTLSSGGLRVSDATHDTITGTGLTMDNTAGLSSILHPKGGSTLSFALGAGASTGYLNFANPNTNAAFLKIIGNTADEVTFDTSSSINIHLVDLTAPSASDTLQLRYQNPYLLIQSGASDNSDFANLVTTGGLDQNGYVLGVGTVGSYATFNFGATDLSGNSLTVPYGSLQLYLNNGDLEIVPEPGTWVMLLGGLVLLVAMERRRGKQG